ncbi:EamA family transporter [Aquipuribacter sp. SD81]|uniref:EamA family transporter n=1 Tax=Aquipuribacter sp. SD81 TaxID=3127703 RepID=UPI0030173256
MSTPAAGTTVTAPRDVAPAPAVVTAASTRHAPDAPVPSPVRGALLALGSAGVNQTGAAVGAQAFAAVGPAGVVAVRQVLAGAVLLAAVRPPLHRFTWRQWWPVLLLAVVFAGMNLSLYAAVERVGLGLAVTLEFLGPLAVALLGSRSRGDLLIAAGAALGVYVLVLPGPSSDWVGVGLALTAATCWASYILLNRLIGTRLPGLHGPAAACTLSGLAFLPLLAALLADGRLVGATLGQAVAAGVLASVVPYAADATALRHLPARYFGVLTSAHPLFAALAGLVVLGQVLELHEWVGVVVVVVVNVVAVVAHARPRRPA